MARVLLENISKVYAGGVQAVDAVSLDVEDGEFVVLVGPSGCGKSTTLRMVAGLEEITGGTLTIDGRVCNEVPARDRDIAMVFQSYALYPHLSVRRNLSFGLERRRRHGSWLRALLHPGYRALARAESDSLRATVEDAARTLGIAALLDRKPGELSGGQRQRVAVGRALVRDPKVFLFDEPLSNLDAKLRVEMRAELKELHRSTGATMLYVTHDQEEAMTLGDRLVVMKDGVVQQCAAPSEVYARPANRFVASFVGTPSMNFVEGTVAGGRFRCEAGEIALGGRFADGPLTLGVRPDRVRIHGPGDRPGDGNGLAADVRLSEHLGDRTDVRLDLDGGARWVARCGGDVSASDHDPTSVGPVRLTFEPDDAHGFDATSGARMAAI